METKVVKIYTDGSCHTQLKVGAWAAIILTDEKKEVIKGIVNDTTHNRMELISLINALQHLDEQDLSSSKIEIYSDSQYVVDLRKRKEKLQSKSFTTKAGKQVQNVELLKNLINYLNHFNIELIKVEAHQKVNETHNYNREVDMIVRKSLREEIRRLGN